MVTRKIKIVTKILYDTVHTLSPPQARKNHFIYTDKGETLIWSLLEFSVNLQANILLGPSALAKFWKKGVPGPSALELPAGRGGSEMLSRGEGKKMASRGVD